jgi:hypothetical protein
MSTPTTYSREFLKSMPEQVKQQEIDLIVNRFIQEIRNTAARGKTSYLYVRDSQRDHRCSPPPPLTDADLIAGFFTRFPGCNIYYDESWVETNSSTRTLKKGIMIDWS